MVLHRRRSLGRLPRFGRHRLCGILCGALYWRKIWNRITRRETAYINMGLLLSSLNFFLSMRQFSQLVDRLLRGRPDTSLSTVSLSFLPLPVLGGIPELALQLFRTREKAAPKKLLRRGLNPFFRGV